MATKKKKKSKDDKALTQGVRILNELRDLYEDLSTLGYTLYEELGLLLDLTKELWNVAVQVSVVVCRTIPVVEKIADRIKAVKL